MVVHVLYFLGELFVSLLQVTLLLFTHFWEYILVAHVDLTLPELLHLQLLGRD